MGLQSIDSNMDAENITELSSSNDEEETQNNTYSEPMVTQDPVNGELVIDIDVSFKFRFCI